jgi:hypothetical protein
MLKLDGINEFSFLKRDTPEAKEFPAIGNKYEVDYGGDLVVQFEFHSINSMTIFGMKGEHKGFKETVEIQVTSIRPGLFMVAWQEKNRTTVVHIEDFEKGIIYANIIMPENNFLRLQGAFKPV